MRCNDCHDNAELLTLQARRIASLRDTQEAIDARSSDPVIAKMAREALTDDRSVRLSEEA